MKRNQNRVRQNGSAGAAARQVETVNREVEIKAIEAAGRALATADKTLLTVEDSIYEASALICLLSSELAAMHETDRDADQPNRNEDRYIAGIMKLADRMSDRLFEAFNAHHASWCDARQWRATA